MRAPFHFAAHAKAWAVSGVILLGCRAPAAPASDVPVALPATSATPVFEVQGALARLIPDPIELTGRDKDVLGLEPGGGVRLLVSGVRVIGLPGGGVLAARDRFRAQPRRVTPLPDRLGGGFAFASERILWRSDRWLATAQPLLALTADDPEIIAGLDRLYLRTAAGGFSAIEPHTGQPVDLGPFPKAPSVLAYAALDGWRAAAYTDLRGALFTTDAGATWQPLAVEAEATRNASTLARALQIASGEDSVVKAPRPASETLATWIRDASTSPLGTMPLAAAIERGWPMSDGTALVAHEGALAWVRVSDGQIARLARDAFPLRKSTCHPMPMKRANELALAFVCGEPQGPTIVYRFDPRTRQLEEAKRFARPRVVLPSGRGAIIVRGPCHDEPIAPSERAYCAYVSTRGWFDVRLRGDIGQERVVALEDGRVAVISPPRGDLSTGRLTLIQEGRAHTESLVISSGSRKPNTLLHGVWMDGFEERRPGVLGGWIDVGGGVVGIEIDTHGRAQLGEYVQELGAVVTSGRYGLGWTGARRAYETTDGGMSWKVSDAPEIIERRLDQQGRARVRTCGPVGCRLAGWLRVGWGEPENTPKEKPRLSMPPAISVNPRPLEVQCHAVSPLPARAPIAPRPEAQKAHHPWQSWTGTVTLQNEFSPIFGVTPPRLRSEEQGLSLEIYEGIARWSPLGRIYAWGPKGGDWDKTGKWTVRWLSPLHDTLRVRSSATSALPNVIVEHARASSGMPVLSSWSLISGDDDQHALLIARRFGRTDSTVFEVEPDHAPVEVRREGGDPLGDIDAAVRTGGHWFLAHTTTGGGFATIIWRVDGGVARELIRIPRAQETYAQPLRLARRHEGTGLAMVLDGQPRGDRHFPTRWLVPVDLDAGQLGEPEWQGLASFADKAVSVCTGNESGWVLDAPWGASVQLRSPKATVGVLSNVFGRFRFERDAVCIERAYGQLDVPGARGLLDLRAQGTRVETMPVSVSVLGDRVALLCR